MPTSMFLFEENKSIQLHSMFVYIRAHGICSVFDSSSGENYERTTTTTTNNNNNNSNINNVARIILYHIR
ncbi:unnamed protein product [Schistosoma turkestanicum]|nr:unnamed protein product [Schistosoma turkestanicum]